MRFTPPACDRPAHCAQGFTLTELLIAVAIAALLGTVAYPAYQHAIHQARRAQAQAALLEVLQQQERYMSQHNRYLAFAPAETDTPFKNFSGDRRDSAAYLIGAQACDSQTLAHCVEVFAEPTYPDPLIQRISITSSGVTSCGDSPASACWR